MGKYLAYTVVEDEVSIFSSPFIKLHFMRQFHKITAILIGLISLNSCDQLTQETTYFSGQLPEWEGDSLFLHSVNSQFPGLRSRTFIDVTVSDQEGNFFYEIENLAPGYYQVTAQNYPRLAYDIYLEPGDSIHITQSAWNAAPGFIVRGKGAEKLAHLDRDRKAFCWDSELSELIRSDRFETALDFKAFADSIEIVRLEQVEQQDIPSVIKSQFVEDIKMATASLLLEHLKFRKYWMTGTFGYTIPDTDYFKDLLPLIEKSEFQSSESKSALQPYLEFIAQRKMRTEADAAPRQDSVFTVKLTHIASLKEGALRDNLTLTLVNDFSHAMQQDQFYDLLKEFKPQLVSGFTDPTKKEIFAHNIAQFTRLQPGNPAPDIQLPNEKGELVSISDYKGKVVYIDFWATWCSPCMKEIPKSLELQEEYRDQPVEFIYIALQSGPQQENDWKNFLVGDTPFKRFLPTGDFPGNHLIAEGQFKNPELLPYQLNFAPTYVLIDQQGVIVDVRAPRPGEIKSHIDRLLNE